MPLASASFLKLASHASKLPVLWQFACPSAAVGSPSSIAAIRAKAPRIRRIAISDIAMSAYAPLDCILAVPARFGDRAACPRNDNSPILTERLAQRRALGARNSMGLLAPH